MMITTVIGLDDDYLYDDYLYRQDPGGYGICFVVTPWVIRSAQFFFCSSSGQRSSFVCCLLFVVQLLALGKDFESRALKPAVPVHRKPHDVHGFEWQHVAIGSHAPRHARGRQQRRHDVGERPIVCCDA